MKTILLSLIFLLAVWSQLRASGPVEVSSDTTVTVTTTTTVVTKVYRGGTTSSEPVMNDSVLAQPRDTVYLPVDTVYLKADTVYLPAPQYHPVKIYSDYATRPRNAAGKIVLAEIDPRLLQEKVIVGPDTIPIVLPLPNYGRYDRGLFNFLFIPKGQWMFGMTASYGEFSSDDVQVLSLIKDFNFKGKIYSLQPNISYFFRSNQSIGLKFNYSRGIGDLGGLSVDFDDDINFTLSDISYYSQTFTASVFYRNYVGLGAEKRFAIFNEIDLAFGSGSSRFKRSYDGELKDTKTLTSKWGLNFSPGLTMFIMDQVCFNVSFGVFGLHVTHEKQYTNGVDEGRRTSSGANFRFNLFNINFGLGVTI